MDASEARAAVTGSAIITGGIYLYRKLVEPAVAPGSPATATGLPATPTQLSSWHAPIRTGEPQPVGVATIPAQLLGKGPVAPVSRFVVGWGFTYIVLSLAVDAKPQFAGMMAYLVALGAALGNGVKVSADINQQLSQAQTPTDPASAALDAAPTVAVNYTGAATPAPAIAAGGKAPRQNTRRRGAPVHAPTQNV